MKLTHANYHSIKNNFLSNSKINDFLRDKAYFKAKHIDHTLIEEQTPSMLKGSMLDYLVAFGEKKFDKKYQPKVLKRDNPDLFESQKTPKKGVEIVSPELIEEVKTMYAVLSSQDAFKDLKNFKKQVILTLPFARPEGGFVGLCGMLDFLWVGEDSAIIVDLKTTSDINPMKYYYKCEDMRYFAQMAFYDLLVRANFPEVKTVACRHLAIENSGLYHCETFSFTASRIQEEKNYLNEIILDVLAEKNFKPRNVSWDSMNII